MGSTQHKKIDKTIKEEDERKFAFKEMVKKNTTQPQHHYRFIEKIGEGTYAEVYKAQCLCTGQLRAIKKVARSANPKQ